MLNQCKAWIAVICLLCVGISAHAQVLRFSIPEYLPYTGTVDGQPGGMAIERVRNILSQAGLTMTVQVVPNYGRCIQQINDGSIDGFFLGSRNSRRDAIAELSDAVVINTWVWVMPSDSTWQPLSADFKGKAKVGVMLNTNPHFWLKTEGYNVAGTATSSAAVLAMLDFGRFDVALMPQLVFEHAVQATARSLGSYMTVSQVEQPFGIYVSKQFIKAHPDVMTRINLAIRQLRVPDGKAKP